MFILILILLVIPLLILINYTYSSSARMSDRKKVVIVGGGLGGIFLARQLDKDFDVTVVEKKTAFFYNVAALRCIVEPDMTKQCFLSYDKMLKNGKVVHHAATAISAQKVVMDNGDELAFDYLVIATGSNNMTPFKAPADLSHAYQYYVDIREKVKTATKVLIVGGGPVGVELAGEIKTEFKGKNVTLIQRSDKLVGPQMGKKFADKMHDKLKGMGINVMLNTSLDVPDNIKQSLSEQSQLGYNVEMRTYQTSNGEVEADLVFWCVGNKINNELLQENFGGALDEHGHIKVNEHLQVEGHDNVFAIGDITNTKELKTYYNAKYHAAIICTNLKACESKKKLAVYKPSGPLIFVSVGKNDGLAQTAGGTVIPGFVVKMVKSRGLFISMVQSSLGNPKP
ncbi:hypothetical protein SAMD00019534_067410, partial [Acytostelium subglobosum LB1]|uniref:hypothetical protein n=1 Tax=Acytostelium subglobosum LB1 TaxID=1410327 RepID=UPI000644F034